MNSIEKFAYKFFGGEVKKKKHKYYNLQKKLRQARIAKPWDVYVSTAIFYSIIASLIGAFIGAIAAYVAVVLIGLPKELTKIYLPPELTWLLQYRDFLVALMIFASFAVIFGIAAYFLVMILPSFIANERKRKIQRNLPYAVTFMYALSRGGMNIIEILRALAASSNTYGEVSREAALILRDMEYFGHDLRSALQNAILLSPSEGFQELLANLLSVIDSGGDITKYLEDKAEQLHIRAVQEQKGFLETLGLIAESYVTAFVAGPLFIIIMTTVMTLIGGASETMLYIIAYVVVPVGSAMFVILINIITPSDEAKTSLFSLEKIEVYKGERIIEPEEDESKKFELLQKAKKTLALREFLSNPLKPIKEKPLLSLVLSVPAAVLFFAVEVLLHLNDLTIAVLDDFIIFSILIALAPLSFFHELKIRRENKIQAEMPDFLKKLATTNETGMTLSQSIALISKTNYGELGQEVKKMWRDIEWGASVTQALIRFANRIRTSLATRIVTLITKASESTGDIGVVLNIAAKDAAMSQQLRKERIQNMFIYVVIIYISFLVFVAIVFILSSTFLPVMASAGSKVQAAKTARAAVMLKGFDLLTYNRLFFHSAVIQGFCSGLIAGQMGEGNVLSGLKHSLIMMIISYLLFTLLIGV
ncbi:MAG: type II secretion system F family protein [Methanocellales archaeon]